MQGLSFSEFEETRHGVFHCKVWGQNIPTNFIDALLVQADKNPNRKARLCLHPTPDDVTQVTFLALVAPYADKLHMHPNRPEIMFPLRGQATIDIYDTRESKPRRLSLDADLPLPISIDSGKLHSLEVVSNYFVFMEVGNGPFTQESTIYI